MKSSWTEIIRAATPLLLMFLGGGIAIAVLFNPAISDAKAQQALSLAGAMVTGGAGLAQSSKGEPEFSVTKEGNNLKVETPGHDE